jgi:hypothetical protein
VHALTDEEVPDEDRRGSLFTGDLFVYTPRPSSLALATASSHIIEGMLGPDPVWAQRRIPEAEFAALFAIAAHTFSTVALDMVSVMVGDFGCDPETTFVGTPALAAVTGLGFLARGIGIPQHPHRDTWYAATPYHLNWFIPLHDLSTSSDFAFHLAYWNTPVLNSSRNFDYDRWRARSRLGRRSLQDAMPLAEPRPLSPIDLYPEVRIGCPAGSVLLSSAAQLYSVGPNETLKTHFSVHFQTLSQFDVETGRGAPNIDAEALATSLRGFVRCSDMSPIPQELARSAVGRRTRKGGSDDLDG